MDDIPETRPGGPAFDDSPHLMAVIALDGILRVVNAAWQGTLGYRTAELVGRNLLRLVDDPDRAMARRLFNSRAGEPVGLALRCKDGSYRAFEWKARHIVAERTLFLVGRDVTDQRRLEVTQSLRMYDLYAEAAKRKKT